MEYKEEDYLQLSGLQHFKFCRRQWALIHIEQQWEDNLRTVEGNYIHKTAHDQNFTESRGDLVIMRSVNVFSRKLGVSGQCDVLEYHRSSEGVYLSGNDGLWTPYPVEYKRGSPKDDNPDILQLCGQAICLEEMLCCDIPNGALYYHEIRRRIPIAFTEDIRSEVRQLLEEMHLLYDRRHTPKVKTSKSCNACSLKEICLPKIMKKRSVARYISSAKDGGNETST